MVSETTRSGDVTPTVMHRAIVEGSSLTGVSVPTAYELAPLSLAKVVTVPIFRAADYSQGCKEHDQCSGHLCRVPSGFVILPHFTSAGRGYTKE